MSRVALDGAVTVRGCRIAALVRVEVGAERIAGRVLGWGRKEPLAVLIARGARVEARDLQGRVMERAEIEALAPGVWDAFAPGG